MFCPFTPLPPLTTLKINILKNEKKSHRYSLMHVYHKLKSHDVWFLKYGAEQTQFFLILDHFLAFYHPENKNFEKMKKTPGDTIISHKYTINDNHRMYSSWHIECNGQIFLSFWTIFAFLPSAPLPPLPPPLQPKKTKFWENEKNTTRYHLTHVFHKWLSYDVWFQRYLVQQTDFFCHFRPCFHLLPPPKNLKNQNFKKMRHFPGDTIILHLLCTINENYMMYGYWDMECDV